MSTNWFKTPFFTKEIEINIAKSNCKQNENGECCLRLDIRGSEKCKNGFLITISLYCNYVIFKLHKGSTSFKGAMGNVPIFNDLNEFLIFLKSSLYWRSMENLFSILIILVHNICQNLISMPVIERFFSDTALTGWLIRTETYWLRSSKDQNSKVFVMTK